MYESRICFLGTIKKRVYSKAKLIEIASSVTPTGLCNSISVKEVDKTAKRSHSFQFNLSININRTRTKIEKENSVTKKLSKAIKKNKLKIVIKILIIITTFNKNIN